MASRRAQKRTETTERILDTAMKLMVEHGYEAFTIARLARELNYAVGALYRYFSGKDSILAALEGRIFAQLAADLQAVDAIADAHLGRARSLSDADASVVRLLAALETFDSLTVRRPMHFWLIAQTLGDPQELLGDELMDDSVVAPLRQAVGFVRGHVEEATRQGVLSRGNAQARTLTLWGGLQGLMMLRKLQRLEPALAGNTLSTDLVRTLLAGWGADAKTVRNLQKRSAKIIAEFAPA